MSPVEWSEWILNAAVTIAVVSAVFSVWSAYCTTKRCNEMHKDIESMKDDL